VNTDLSLERIEEAARLIDPPLLNTPQFSDPMLSEALGREVVVKMENVNPIGSFKGRGADYFVSGLERRDQRLVTTTAGNWGSGLAYAGRRHGHGVDIFVDSTARPGKLKRMRALGANVTKIDGGPAKRMPLRGIWRTASLGTCWSPTESRRRLPKGTGRSLSSFCAAGSSTRSSSKSATAR
jgi:threonine dehydratase